MSDSQNESNDNRIGNLASQGSASIKYTGDSEGVTGYHSIFSRYNLFSSGPGYLENKGSSFEESDWGDGNARTRFKNPTTNTLCNLDLGAIEYEYSDFAYCSDFGEIPNHWMITLRRFGSPVGDNIWSPDSYGSMPDVARAVGYMTSEKNKMESLLGFSVKLKYKKIESKIDTKTADSSKGFGSGSLFSTKMGKRAKTAITATSKSQSSQAAKGDDAMSFDPVATYTNTVYGPIDVVDNLHIRDRGLEHEQSFELVFEYTLKSIDGVNPRAAMLDLLTNLLLLTYNRGDFWGGANRLLGKKAPGFLGDPSKLASGDLAGYVDSAMKSMTAGFEKLTGGKGASVEGLKNAAKNIGGNIANMLGGMALDQMGRPEILGFQALLSGEDTGEWHLTIGNPLYPIMVAGNLKLDNSTFELSGPIGVDGFPSKLKLTCTLTPAMPRDRSGIQAMFSFGNGNIKLPVLEPSSKTYPMNKSLSKSNGGGKGKTLHDNPIDANIASLNRFGNWSPAIVEEKRKWNA